MELSASIGTSNARIESQGPPETSPIVDLSFYTVLNKSLNTLLREHSYDADKIRASMGWSSTDVQDGYTHWNAGSFDGQREIIDSIFN